MRTLDTDLKNKKLLRALEKQRAKEDFKDERAILPNDKIDVHEHVINFETGTCIHCGMSEECVDLQHFYSVLKRSL